MMVMISGSGGGGKSSTPKEAKDDLDSTQSVTLIDLISEGEIQGLRNGLQSIFLDNTPLQSANGSLNFKNVQVFTTTGTQNQNAIPIASAIEDERAVAVEVTTQFPITRTIVDPNVNAARVTISVPQLQEFRDNGDIVGAALRLQIQVQYNGGGFTTVIDDTISGRTADLYQKDYIINRNGAFPWDIRVVRITPDSTSSRLVNNFLWSSYTEIIYAKLRYPNSALIGIRASAEQFSNVPSRAYRIRGIKVRIPNNATVDQNNGRLIYNGVWNGTFGAAQWCSDPAWILWDLLTSRYGFGDQINAAQLDKWTFFEASKYCSELVPDGFGKLEPRFSCNVNIQTQEEAYTLINNLCSVFRAMPYWAAGTLTVSQDRPADSAYLFTLANVSEDGFTYAGGTVKGRPTVAVVSYLDLDIRDTAYEQVEDQELIAKWGINKVEIQAFACTSRGQAARIGEWLLYSDWYESEVVTFTTSLDAGVVVRPGQIIDISDPVRAGTRRGGRIAAATTTTVTVDDAAGLPSSGGTLSIVMPDGTVETRSVSSRSNAVITVSAAYSAVPMVNSVWVYETSSLQTSQWRVIGIQEQDGVNYEVTAISYNASKYDYIERDRPLQFRDVSNLNQLPDVPVDLRAEILLYESNGSALIKIILQWRQVVGVNRYRVEWRYANGNWNIVTVQGYDFEILDAQKGHYEFRVYSLSASLKPSVNFAALSFDTSGNVRAPFSVTGLSLVPVDESTATLSWDRASDLDVLLGGKVLIRHENVQTGAEWDRAQSIVQAAAGSQTQKLVPLLEGTYLVKFESSAGQRSQVPAAVVVNMPEPQPRLMVRTYAEDAEDPPFNGNVIDMIYSLELDALILADGGTPVDELAPDGDWDALPTIDSEGGVLPRGEYEFGSTFDAGGVYDVNMQRRLVTRPYLPSDLWDDLTTLVDDLPSIDGDIEDAVDAKLYVRTTNDNPAGTPTWSPWREMVNAIVRGRGFQFKLEATSLNSDIGIIIDELGAVLELQQHTEFSAVLTTEASEYAATYANAFAQPPSIGIIGFQMNTGDYFRVTNVTRTGFVVTFYDSAANPIARSFTYTAVGYGREIN